MNKAFLKVILLLLIIFGWVSAIYALSVQTHQAINESIAQNTLNGFSLDEYLIRQLAFKSGIKEKLNSLMVWEWIRDGGRYEDKPNWTWNPNTWAPDYVRSANHFHNPLKPVEQAGFTGIWGSGLLSGKSAVLWSQNYIGTQYPGGYYSWYDVRDYFFKALTSTSQNTRNANFADTFRGLGQLMHLVQDMSVPEHARDDGHYADAYEEFLTTKPDLVNTLIQSPIFFDMTALASSSTFTLAPVPIANLFDTNRYNGTNPNITVSSNIGLSEYTNANFVSSDTLFRNFAYPSKEASVAIENREIPDVLNPGNNVKRKYYIKTADGETNNGLGYRLAGVDYYWFYRENNNPVQPEIRSIPPMDNYVYEDYAKLLLPRAVGYSAGLLNYFFRGTLDITWPDTFVYSIADGSKTPYIDSNGNRHQQFTTIKAWVGNTSYIKDQAGNVIGVEGIKNGIIQAVARYKIIPNYASDLSNYPPDGNAMKTVQYSYSVSKSETVNDGDIIPEYYTEYTFDFTNSPIPAGITDLTLQVVFKGTLGNEADNAIAVGMIDLMEPTHLVFWNLTDRFSYGTICPDNPGYYCYHLYTKDQIDSNAPLKALLTARGEDYTPKNLTFTFAFKDGEPTGLLPPVAQAVVPPGGHVRLITLIDGQSTYGNYVQYNWQSDYAWDYFSGAITETRPNGTIQATPAPAFRFHQETGVPVPFIQHNDYEIINCYPETTGGCVINESEEPPAEPTPVPVTLMFN